MAREKYGTKPREELIAPAIALAGKASCWSRATSPRRRRKRHARAGSGVGEDLPEGWQPLPLGATLVQPDLAKTLPAISEGGAAAFYTGETADLIVKASEANGGILATADFERYAVRELEPLACSYRGYDIVSSPPPSSGG